MKALKAENEELKAELARAKEDHQYDNLVHQKELESLKNPIPFKKKRFNVMLKGRDLIMIFDRFVGPKKGSSVAQDARVQVRTPDGKHYDVMSVNLVENKILGARETHRIVISTHEEVAKMGSPIKLL
jgi:hypothetical protein